PAIGAGAKKQMEPNERNILALYVSFAMLSTSQALSWQFISYFILHDLQVTNYLLLNIIWSISPLVMMITMGFWGSLSDRIRKRKPFMLLGFLGYGATFLFSSFVTDGFQYFIVLLIGSIFAASAVPVGQAYLTSNTEKKGERIGYYMVAASTGWFFGALMSGFLYGIIGMFVIYRIAAVICVGAIVICAVFVRELDDPEIEILDSPPTIPAVTTARNSRDVILNPGMLGLAFAVVMSAIGINAIASVMSIVIVDELGGPQFYVGLANATATLSAVIITGYLGKKIDQRGPAGVLISAYLLYVIFSIGFGTATDPIVATAFFALPIYALSNTAAIAFGAILSSDADRGKAMGIINGAQNAGGAFGPIIGGLFIEYVFLTVQPVSWIGMIFSIIAVFIGITLYPLAKRLRAEKDATKFASETVLPY
ncbi:MAG: MFS transporter, partial [Candidatus Thorarchaeota archaeon]